MSPMDHAVTFLNQDNETLFGVVHVPDTSDDRKMGVVIVNPGIKYRVAPNRLNVKIARNLCAKGYTVLRFDPSGVGDSEGELPSGSLVADIWEQVQEGLFVDDMVVAGRFLIEEYGVDGNIFAGSCGGAITSLMAATKDERVHALLLIDIPVNLRAANMTFADKVVEGGEGAERLFKVYIAKIFQPQSWLRLLTLQTNFRALLKVLKMKARQKLGLVTTDEKRAREIEDLIKKRKLNKFFFDSVEQLVASQTKMLFVTAEKDPGTEVFNRFFRDGYMKSMKESGKLQQLSDIAVVEKANHVYTFEESQKSLLSQVDAWIDRV